MVLTILLIDQLELMGPIRGDQRELLHTSNFHIDVSEISRVVHRLLTPVITILLEVSWEGCKVGI